MTTTISSSSYGMQRLSPRDMLQNTLASQVASGAVSSSDESALSSALDTIDQAMKADRGSFSSTRTAPPSPDEAKQKISDLIAQQVEAGTLTEDQAKELQEVFDQTFQSMRRTSSPGVYSRCCTNSTDCPKYGLRCNPDRNPSTMCRALISNREMREISSGRKNLL